MSGSYATYPSLRGRRVIITGGSSGIGRSLVEHFAMQGSVVAFLDIDAEGARATQANVTAANAPAARFFPCDASDADQLRATVETAAATLGGVDVVIANAANDERHATETVTSAAWDRCMAINLKHQFFAIQGALPAMKRAGAGSIVCLGSISWLNNTTGMAGYITAKAGVHGLVRTLARELGPLNIRVNALLPGWTMTPKQRDTVMQPGDDAIIAREQCLPGFVMPDDIARMALFLAADDSRMCTQQAFIVDGGWV